MNNKTIKIAELEELVEKIAKERDYYYELWKKANAYIVTHSRTQEPRG